MCGGSFFELDGETWSFYLGYYGGEIKIDDLKYGHDEHGKLSSDSETKMRNKLKTYKKSKLINIIIMMVQNGNE